MADTSIEWTNKTWNPIVGCSVLSPGCANCYAMRLAARLVAMGQDRYEGLTTPTKTGHVWNGSLRFVDEALRAPLGWHRPKMIFVNSMSDLFHESVPDDWIDKVFAVMALCPQHIFQVLTKRAERMRKYFEARREGDPWAEAADAVSDLAGMNEHPVVLEPRDIPLPNVWLGVSTEDQARADERIPHLLQTPAAIRWISAEPLLGSLDLTRCGIHYTKSGPLHLWRGGSDGIWRKQFQAPPPEIGWVVAGGESGHRARPCHPAWIRSLRDQCSTAGVPFFFKQWGQWAPHVFGDTPVQTDGRIAGPPRLLADVCLDDSVQWMTSIGKKAAGAELDGREHREFPQ